MYNHISGGAYSYYVCRFQTYLSHGKWADPKPDVVRSKTENINAADSVFLATVSSHNVRFDCFHRPNNVSGCYLLVDGHAHTPT